MTDGYIAPHDWDTLTREERDHVLSLREARDRRREVGAVTRTDAATTSTTEATTGDEQPARGIGSTMSRRNEQGGQGTSR